MGCSDKRRRELRKSLAKDLARTLEAHGRMREDVARRRGRPPQPGELYLFTFLDDARAEWAILSRTCEEPPVLLAVAADLHPAVGSHDVAVEVIDGGPLTLRCGLEIHLEEADLTQALLVGLLPTDAVDRAREKLKSIHRGENIADQASFDTDFESEYQTWLQEVEAERALVLEQLAQARTLATNKR